MGVIEFITREGDLPEGSSMDKSGCGDKVDVEVKVLWLDQSPGALVANGYRAVPKLSTTSRGS